jgi:hemerythrin-like metal-binding protein
MTERRAAMGFLTNRKIGTKVSLGFACVLAILAVVSGLAWLSFRSTAEGFQTFTRQVTAVGIARDIDRGFVALRRFVREYALGGVETNIDAAKQEQARLTALLRQGLIEITNPESHRKLEDISQSIDAYIAMFDKVVAGTKETNRLQISELTPMADGLQKDLETIGAVAARDGDDGLEKLASDAAKRLLLARLNIALLTSGARGVAEVDNAFVAFNTALSQVGTESRDPARRDGFAQVEKRAAAYLDTFRAAADLRRQISSIVNGPMRETAEKVQAGAEAIKLSGIDEQQASARATLAAVESTSDTVLWLSAGGLLIGGVAAWAIGRGIATPVIRLERAMVSLAKGDNHLTVPELDRGDEIGAMAKAVDVFRRDALEMERLRTEQENQKRDAQAERRTALRRLADGFETQVGGVVNAVGSATAQLDDAAKRMRENADRTADEVTSVSSASAQAAANAQAVASASEQLTASINEIGKQVESAREVASLADAEASETTELMRRLSETVNSIGAIVALINDIASQTNLLALNATIEAARAGEAGKGFAVVASEVKTLASQTAKATDEIAGKIGAVQSGTEDAAKAIASITKVMARMSAISTAIATAVEQQSSATAEIARNVEQAAAGTNEVSSRIAHVDAAARETGSTASEISGSATELFSQAQNLRGEVSRLLDQVRSDRETMRLMTWDNAWNVGIPTVDRHHREFVDAVNQLFAALMDGDARDKVPNAVQTIEAALEPHFAEEETAMRRNRYADLAAHQQQHRAFLSRFREFAGAIGAGEAIDVSAFFDFISGWFRQHVTEHDAPLARFLNARRAA